MIDLNDGSGCQYEAVSQCAGVGIAINAAIDAALLARNRAQPPRRYVSTSGLGRECLRQYPVRLSRRAERRGPGVRALDVADI